MRKNHQQILRIVLLPMFGAMLIVSKIAFEGLPNIHPVAMLIMVFTLAYRKWALVPIYIYVILFGAFYGFQTWWYPHLYIWTILWAATMLLPKNLSDKKAAFIYPAVCGLHGFLYGILWSPFQALFYGFTFEQTLAWIGTGLTFDIRHGISNICMGLLILPLSKLLRRENEKRGL